MKPRSNLCAYPANLMAIIALIFFCFLFFHQGKKRKSRFKGNAPCVVLAEEVHAGGASDFARFDVQLDLLHRPIVVARSGRNTIGAEC